MFRNGLKMNVIKRFFKFCYLSDNRRTLYILYKVFLGGLIVGGLIVGGLIVDGLIIGGLIMGGWLYK